MGNVVDIQGTVSSIKVSFLELLPALERLDCILDRAVAEAEYVFQPQTTENRFRGLYIQRDEVEHLLRRAPGESLFAAADYESDNSLTFDDAPGSRLALLRQAFGLSAFDIDVLLLALAPEVDRRYELIYAYLQDHVARQRPSVDLVLQLLCPDAEARIEHRRHFDPGAPLLRAGIIQLLPDPRQPLPSLLAQVIQLDDQIVRFLLHQDGLDARLAPFCQVISADRLFADFAVNQHFGWARPRFTDQAVQRRHAQILYYQGPPQADKQEAAAALAAEMGMALLVVDLPGVLNAEVEGQEILRLVFLYARLYRSFPSWMKSTGSSMSNTG